MPEKPIIKEPTNRQVGKRRSIMASTMATQIGVAAMISAASPESARCSDQLTMPFPPAHNSKPEANRVMNSWRVSRRRDFARRAHPKRMTPAIKTRINPIANGGKPDPSRTATRIARYVLPHTIYTTNRFNKPCQVICFSVAIILLCVSGCRNSTTITTTTMHQIYTRNHGCTTENLPGIQVFTK